jgi:uncharacterized membrane protein
MARSTGTALVAWFMTVRSPRGGWLLVITCAVLSTACLRKPVRYAEARAVVDRRCVECHSKKPTSRAFPFAPQGVMLDTAEQMQKYAERIKGSVAVERSMPLANLSGMTDEERTILSRWVDAGAKVP